MIRSILTSIILWSGIYAAAYGISHDISWCTLVGAALIGGWNGYMQSMIRSK